MPPKLIDIKPPQSNQSNQSNIVLTETTIMKDFDVQNNLSKFKIGAKINSMETVLRKFQSRLVMMDAIIDRTYQELESFAPNEFTRRGQKQNTLMKQLETLGLVHDSILKYEDTIYKYQKMLMDAENYRVNNYAKLESLKTEEITTKDNLAGLLKDIQDLFGDTSKLSQPDVNSPQELLMQDIQDELAQQNYK